MNAADRAIAIGRTVRIAAWTTSSIRRPRRDGTPTATRRKRNGWTAIGPSLLQELRVAQTGVQLLTGFLLTLPFQQRFTQLDGVMRTVYLVTVACSIGATVLLVAPVSMHRLLFRRHRLKTVVSAAHSYAMVGMVLLGVALAGVAVVIFDTVVGRTAAWIAGRCTLLALAAFWYVMPTAWDAATKTTATRVCARPARGTQGPC